MAASINGPVTLAPDMTGPELDLFARHCSAASRIVEFGSGGSTVFTVEQSTASICSVEADASWIEALRKRAEIQAAERQGRLKFVHVNIGRTVEWSWPADETRRSDWPTYSLAPWRTEPMADFVFVDGRFRLACILRAVLHVAPGAIIAIHDFCNRPHYHAALPFLTHIESVETLAIFFRPAQIDRTAADRLVDASEYDPR